MDRFAIAQAFLQLEADYNEGGILQERPSNQRRRESIGCQLHRIGYLNLYGWVDITGEPELDGYGYADPFEEEVRSIYVDHALKWGLPMDEELKATARRLFVPEYLAQFPKFTRGFSPKPTQIGDQLWSAS